ncbi:peroxidase [Nocardioides sp. GY 10127]|nr:peroxidase [Nocardioides sp. GY 10127]
MFRELPSHDVPDDVLVALAESMIQPVTGGHLDLPIDSDDRGENTAVRHGELRAPAAYTFFGQFVDHDITFDPVSSLTRQNDPEALVNFRTPRFDLDNVYGRGPADQPYLYEPGGLHFTLGEEVSGDARYAGPDLPRVASGRALIGDPRNDENLVIAQLQCLVLRFHNAVVDQVSAEHPTWSRGDRFRLAQQVVRWHYQWVVVRDFLPRLVGDDVVDSLLGESSYLTSPSASGSTARPDLRFYRWRENPYMPVEFSVAAYRYGHSTVRPSYALNDASVVDPPIPGVSRIPTFSGEGGPHQSLNGFRPLEKEWGLDWRFFLPGIRGAQDTSLPAGLPQPSFRIDTQLAHPLGRLPESTAEAQAIVSGFPPDVARSLATLNLVRGKRMGLPAGEDVARRMGLEPLGREQLYGDSTLTSAQVDALVDRTPLWFYCLKEADVLTGGTQLGPVGGRIVAEVLVGLLAGDPTSYLNVEPTWTPTLPGRRSGQFTLSDLANVVLDAEGIA